MSLTDSLTHSLTDCFADRLVTLCDGRPGLRGTLHTDVREPTAVELSPSTPAPRPSTPVLDFIASDDTLDRYGEIIVPSGWRLENYRRNPVFQNAHQYGDIIFTLGKALVTEVRAVAGRPVLYQRIEFAVEANPMARIAYGLYRGKFLNAVSVGFIPLRWQDGPQSSSSLSSSSFRRRYLEQELLEVSAVGIPANPEALQLGLKAGAIQKADVRELAELLGRLCAEGGWSRENREEEFRSHKAGISPNAGAPGIDADEAQWLRLAREIRRVMRET